MKKIIFLLLLLTLSLAGCEKLNEDVPLVLYNEVDPYILQFKKHIMDNAQGRVKIVSYDSQNSQLVQNEIINDIFSKNPQLIIVNPVDRLGAYTIIDKAKEQDIPIIFINREPLRTDMFRWSNTYYIGAPAENSAVIQSEIVIDLFGNPTNLSDLDKNDDNVIQLILFKGEQGHQDAEIRSTVVIEELESYGYTLDILSIEICDWQKQIAFTSMNEFIATLSSEVEIELVISNNDAMALGAIDSMIANDLFIDNNGDGVITHGVDTWIPVIGIDGINDAIESIEAGYLYGTVINDSETMSEYLVELVEALLNDTDLSNLSFQFDNEKYVWVDYQRFEKE